MDIRCKPVSKRKKPSERSLQKKKVTLKHMEEDYQGTGKNEFDKMVDDLIIYEQERTILVKEARKKIQDRNTEILEIEYEIEQIIKKEREGAGDGELEDLGILRVNKQKVRIHRLMQLNRRDVRSSIFYPYILELEALEKTEAADVTYRRKLRTAMINLQPCSRAIDFFKKQEDSTKVIQSRSVDSKRPINVERMVAYSKMFIGLKRDKKNSGEVVEYDFNAKESDAELATKDEPPGGTFHFEEDNTDAEEVLDILQFNTRKLLRHELRSKCYTDTLCMLADQYKRFYVPFETLREEVRVLGILVETKLHMPSDVRDKLSAHSCELFRNLDALERTYRKLYKIVGMKDIAAMVLLPEQVRPYERCYRLIETTELRSYIQLVARQTTLMQSLLEEQDQVGKDFK